MRSHTRIAMCLLLLAGCDCRGRQAAKLEGEETVLASVNGSEITKYDVDRAILDSLGSVAASRLDADARKRVLESLVQSRAIAQASEEKLTPRERAQLDKRVAAFREELLVKEYLSEHGAGAPVSPDRIQKYYDAHPERFGAREQRSYELITTSGEVDPAARAALFAELGAAAAQSDWQGWVEQQKRDGRPLLLTRGQVDDPVLHPKLRALLTRLEPGKASAITLIDGRPHVARISAVQQRPPRPLAEVSGEIRKLLEPAQLRDAVKEAAGRVMKEAEVAYR